MTINAGKVWKGVLGTIIKIEIIGGLWCHVQGPGPAYVYMVICVSLFIYLFEDLYFLVY